MSQPRPSSPYELSSAIDEAWSELQGFLSGITPAQASRQDANGWAIKDHVTHIAVWEASVTILFRGGRRHEALGIDEAFYLATGLGHLLGPQRPTAKDISFDQMNEVIKTRHQGIPLSEALTMLSDIHQGLMVNARSLTEANLQTTVSDFFPQAPRGDDRTMATFIIDNTADHYLEHLQWMKDLADRAA
jgi:Protein of unknown function (DUF1706)